MKRKLISHIPTYIFDKNIFVKIFANTYTPIYVWCVCTCTCICVYAAAGAAKSLQSCPTLCDLTDGSPLGSSVPGILQARILEWVAISFSNAWKWKVKVKSLSCAWLLATPVDCSPPGSSVHGIFHARVLEWGAVVFSICVCAYVYMHTHIWDNLFKSGTGQFDVCLQYLNFVLYFMCYVDINLHRPKF